MVCKNPYPLMSIQTPLKLKMTKLKVESNPTEITFNAIMLGTRSLPGLAWKIRTDSIIKVKKNPLTAAAQANEKNDP